MKYGIIGLILGLITVIFTYAILGFIVEPGPIKIEITGINYLNALLVIIVFGLLSVIMGLVTERIQRNKVPKTKKVE